ncbi:hypothetical protein [uncultured Leptotrichia sp.]|jgi:hypothetical protein|uniref:hypothetical protein n=1 Tax=uncultured Leptotrichia sp. TaxID=159271 RepID=UPI00205CA960|nr:hypothetical protein [uncultured Leptotrichia sp.]DAW74107.1 MAG TPA: minor tail protein Z [Caudoviricetes sp.]
MFTIQFDESVLNDIENKFIEFPQQAPRALASALNRVSSMTKTRMVRNARKIYTVKYGELLKGLTANKAFPAKLIAQINSKGNYLGLDNFQLNPSTRIGRTPVTATVKNGNGIMLNGNTFIAYRDGHLGAFEREGSGRLPIKRKYGPSAPQMLGPTTWLPDLDEFMSQKLNERFEHELNRLLSM